MKLLIPTFIVLLILLALNADRVLVKKSYRAPANVIDYYVVK